MIELRLRVIPLNEIKREQYVQQVFVGCGNDDFNGVKSTEYAVLQYRENVVHKKTDSHVTYWDWSDWQDVEIEE